MEALVPDKTLQSETEKGLMRITTFNTNPYTELTMLRNALRPHLPWHGARLTLIAEFLIAVFRVKTVNLTE